MWKRERERERDGIGIGKEIKSKKCWRGNQISSMEYFSVNDEMTYKKDLKVKWRRRRNNDGKQEDWLGKYICECAERNQLIIHDGKCQIILRDTYQFPKFIRTSISIYCLKKTPFSPSSFSSSSSSYSSSAYLFLFFLYAVYYIVSLLCRWVWNEITGAFPNKINYLHYSNRTPLFPIKQQQQQQEQ